MSIGAITNQPAPYAFGTGAAAGLPASTDFATVLATADSSASATGSTSSAAADPGAASDQWPVGSIQANALASPDKPYLVADTQQGNYVSFTGPKLGHRRPLTDALRPPSRGARSCRQVADRAGEVHQARHAPRLDAVTDLFRWPVCRTRYPPRSSDATARGRRGSTKLTSR